MEKCDCIGCRRKNVIESLDKSSEVFFKERDDYLKFSIVKKGKFEDSIKHYLKLNGSEKIGYLNNFDFALSNSISEIEGKKYTWENVHNYKVISTNIDDIKSIDFNKKSECVVLGFKDFEETFLDKEFLVSIVKESNFQTIFKCVSYFKKSIGTDVFEKYLSKEDIKEIFGKDLPN